MIQSSSNVLTATEDAYNKLNLPSLPPAIKELLVTFAPWLSLLSGALGLLVFVPGALLLLVLSPVAGLGGAGLGYVMTIIHLVLSVVGAVLSLMAFRGLRKRSLGGWTMLFWATAVYLVAGLLPLSIGGLISTIIGGALALYLLFQTKPYYDGTIVPAGATPAAADITTPASTTL
jgi:hypothetical protein